MYKNCIVTSAEKHEKISDKLEQKTRDSGAVEKVPLFCYIYYQ
jgi:hypothetical protein